MSVLGSFKNLSSGSIERFAIYERGSNRPHVLVVYPTRAAALADLSEHPHRDRLFVCESRGCGARGSNGRKCNLAVGHDGDYHEEIFWLSPSHKQTARWSVGGNRR